MGLKGKQEKKSGDIYAMALLFPETTIRVIHPLKGEMTKIGSWFHDSKKPRPEQNLSIQLDREYHSFSVRNVKSFEEACHEIASSRFEQIVCQSEECYYMTLEQGIDILREAMDMKGKKL